MKKGLVIIHGAGKAMSTFHVETVNALAAIMGAPPPTVACWYGDLYDVGTPVSGLEDAALTPEARRFKEGFAKMVVERKRAIEATIPPGELEGPISDAAFLIGDIVRDVMGYLWTDRAFQREVQKRLREKLLEAKSQFDQTILLSHSLGTVISFDVMRAGAQDFNVGTYITTGSPLLKCVVLGARTPDVGQITLQNVPKWVNYFDTTDPVADPISPRFRAYPVEDVFVNVHDLPVESHDYFRNPRVLQALAAALS